MEDRNVQHPEYFLVEKVPGTENIFKFTPAPGEVYAEGTLINKATLWKDATAALFGLGADSVPDDGFAWLGKYNQHWWRRRVKTGGWQVKTNSSEITSIYAERQATIDRNIWYSKELDFDESGNPILKNPNVVSVDWNNYTAANVIKGYYFQSEESSSGSSTLPYSPRDPLNDARCSIRYVSSGASDFTQDESDYNRIRGYTSSLSISYQTSYTEWEYVQSSDRSAYPDSGEQDGYEYEYLGVPFDNAVGAPKVEVGSYTGTGTYGSGNPNKLTFGFEPKIVLIYTASFTPGNGYWNNCFLYAKGVLTAYVASTSNAVQISASGNNLNWYSSNGAQYQLNTSGTEYKYLAIG